MKRPPLFADIQRERGLASLARADKGHRRLVTKRLKNAGLDIPLDHPCVLSIEWKINKDKIRSEERNCLLFHRNGNASACRRVRHAFPTYPSTRTCFMAS